MHWRRKWQPTPVFLPGESQGQGSLVGCRLWGRTESDMTEVTAAAAAAAVAKASSFYTKTQCFCEKLMKKLSLGCLVGKEFFYIYFFKFYFIFKLYIIVLVLPIYLFLSLFLAAPHLSRGRLVSCFQKDREKVQSDPFTSALSKVTSIQNNQYVIEGPFEVACPRLQHLQMLETKKHIQKR